MHILRKLICSVAFPSTSGLEIFLFLFVHLAEQLLFHF